MFQSKVHQDNTPIATTKIIKNSVEVTGMRNSHVRIILTIKITLPYSGYKVMKIIDKINWQVSMYGGMQECILFTFLILNMYNDIRHLIKLTLIGICE